MASARDVTFTQAVISALFVSVVLMASFGIYVQVAGHQVDLVDRVINSAFLWVPATTHPYLEAGGPVAVLVGIGLLSVHALAFALLGLLAGAMFRWRRKSPTQPRAIPAAITTDPRRHLAMRAPTARMQLVVPSIGDDGQLTTRAVTNVTPEAYYHLARKTLRFPRAPTTAVEALEVALWEILAAHRNWPADPSGHHSDRSLIDHSQEVASRLYEATKHPLARVIGLAHDLGKVVTFHQVTKRKTTPNPKAPSTRHPRVLRLGAWYRRWEKRVYPPAVTIRKEWKRRSKLHDRIGAHILQMLPEFQALAPADQNTVFIVLAYTHHPKSTPRKRTSHVELSLIRKLGEIDGITTASEQAAISDYSTDPTVVTAVAEAIHRMLPTLNINAFRGGIADGWTKDVLDYVGVQEKMIRAHLAQYLSPQYVQMLGLTIETARNHPARPVIRQALRQLDYLLVEHAGLRPTNSLFSVKVGKIPFHGVYLLDRAKLEEIMPDAIAEWGSNDQYRIRVVQGTGAEVDGHTPSRPEQRPPSEDDSEPLV